ncbi:MAG: serine protease [Acidobacteriia bacterium]|nr:serine protease [Terriglobia bacterium]
MSISLSQIYDAVKKATVAIVASIPGSGGRCPFTIIGSGFCVRSEGVVITCEHVFKAFVDPKSYQRLMQSIGRNDGQPVPVKSVVPHAMFYSGARGTEIRMDAVSIATGVAMKDFDLAALKLHEHSAFPQGYPTLPIADYSELHEMMEVATCGYPLGESLHDQLGTVTSSFTKGIISSIIPAQGVDCEHLRGFQLDLTATNGNSGGPVFSLATGRVFGVLQKGVVHPNSQIVQGLTKAEPIYPLLDTDLVDRLARGLWMPGPR